MGKNVEMAKCKVGCACLNDKYFQTYMAILGDSVNYSRKVEAASASVAVMIIMER